MVALANRANPGGAIVKSDKGGKARRGMSRRAAVLVVLLSLAAGCMHQGVRPHRASVTLRVIDESGDPIEGADVQAGFFGSGQGGKGMTDLNGSFRFAGRAVSSFHCWVTKSGYYGTHAELWGGPSTRQMSPPTNQYVVLLKKVIDPVPMLAREVSKIVPVLDQKVGFDLQEGDWVPPFGKGARSDIMVTAHYVTPGAAVYEKRLTVSFPNADDGLVDGRDPMGGSAGIASDLPVPQLAPLDGYRREMVQLQRRSENEDPVNTACTLEGHVFRVRSVRDAAGKLVRANHGWIVWGLEMGGRDPVWKFQYYFNPNPESRSLEPANLPRMRESE